MTTFEEWWDERSDLKGREAFMKDVLQDLMLPRFISEMKISDWKKLPLKTTSKMNLRVLNYLESEFLSMYNIGVNKRKK